MMSMMVVKSVARSIFLLGLLSSYVDAHARGGKKIRTISAVAPIDGAVFTVLDYGARGDNLTDCTSGFNAALEAAGNAGGGIVFIPSGVYRFGGHLAVPSGVTLRGTYSVVPSHDLRGSPIAHDGSILIPTEGRGQVDAPPFIHVQANAAAVGFVVYYEEQESVSTPVPYPWTFFMDGNNGAVTDVELLGCFNCVNATRAGRHYIARLQGQPINIGIFVDETYDIGRIEDVHWNPWYSSSKPFVEYQLMHGRAFVFGRSDWEYVFNCFCFGYSVGYHFIETATGAMNGNFLGIGADLAINASVLVDQSQPAGLLITNGEFTAFHNDDWLPGSVEESTQVVISASNTGAVKFVDSSFWGPSSQIAIVEGTGSVTFSSCEFVEWDEQKRDGRAAIQLRGKGSLLLNGNHFNQDKAQVDAGADTKRLVMIGNVMEGPLRVSVANNSTTNVQIGLNAVA